MVLASLPTKTLVFVSLTLRARYQICPLRHIGSFGILGYLCVVITPPSSPAVASSYSTQGQQSDPLTLP